MSNQKYLSHYGILGMKWGVRRQPGPDGLVGKSRGQAIKEWGSEAGKLTKTNLRHPGIVAKAKEESINAEPTFRNRLRRTMLYENTDNIKDVNARVAVKLKIQKEKKEAERRAQEKKKAPKNQGPTNNQLRMDRHEAYEKEYERLAKEHGLKEKQQNLYNFSVRNGLDSDDGGGGSRAAGRKFEEMQYEIIDLDDKINSMAKRAEAKYMIDTYGEERINALNRSDTVLGAAFAATVLATPLVVASAPLLLNAVAKRL